MATKNKAAPRRVDAVLIRKSTQEQDNKGQIANVKSMLSSRGVSVSDENWFVCTVPRAKVSANEEFKRLMAMVEKDQVDTLYIESQDRFGTKNNQELFALLGFLANHGTKLFDLRSDVDLTDDDDATEMRAFLGGLKSKKERLDLSYRSLRTRVQNFKATGSWPTGTHPFGYGKRCTAPDGRLLWEWHPVSRSKGQVFFPGPKKGKLLPGPNDIKIPRKSKFDRTCLVPNRNKVFVESVKLIFDLYTHSGLSRRMIALRLNKEGRRFYDRLFTHTFVTQILTNPAYMGDTHFGKSQAGELHTFNPSGELVALKRAKGVHGRDAGDRIVKTQTHESLVDRKTWDKAQKKVDSEKVRKSFATRNPAYYLKQIFVCGHCGKGMTGRTEIDRTTGRKKVVYACQSYTTSRYQGTESKCGYQTISHADAEKLLFDKIRELDLDHEEMSSDMVKSNTRERLEKLKSLDSDQADRWAKQFEEGAEALIAYFRDEVGLKASQLGKLRTLAQRFYCDLPLEKSAFANLPVKLKEFKSAVQQVEAAGVSAAQAKIERLNGKHRDYTFSLATSTDRSKIVLREEIDRLEAEIAKLEQQVVPLSERLRAIGDAEDERAAERRAMRRDLPAMENREKGEALRALFQKVTLYWRKEFHPARKDPDKPRKTDRPGRNSYHLEHDKFEWQFTQSTLVGSW